MGKVFELAANSFDKVELYTKSESKLSVRISDGKPKGGDGSSITEYALRAISGDKMGTAVTTSDSDTSLVERAKISLENQNTNAMEFSSAAPNTVEAFDPKVNEMTSEILMEEGLRISKIFSELAPEVKADVSISTVKKNIAIKNSLGFDHSFDKTEYNVGISTKSPKGFGETFKVKNGSTYQPMTQEDIEKLIEMHRISQNKVKGIKGKLPVIFSGNAMGALMLRVLAGVNSDIVLKGISPVKDKMGELVFADHVTIRDDGTLKGGLGTCAFDDEGTPSSNTILYENGRLNSFLADINSAKKLNMAPTGNSFKRTMFSEDIEDQPSIDASNLLIEGNTMSDEDLIKQVKQGIYVSSVMGAHTGNINAGDYSLNVSSGYLIEDGKIVGKVENTMVSGNVYQDFKNIVALGTELKPMLAIFFSLGYSPDVLFKDISVVVD